MKFTHDDLCRIERTTRSVSSGLGIAGISKETRNDLQSLEYIMSVIRQAGSTDMSIPEDKAAAMECLFDGLFR